MGEQLYIFIFSELLQLMQCLEIGKGQGTWVAPRTGSIKNFLPSRKAGVPNRSPYTFLSSFSSFSLPVHYFPFFFFTAV